MELIETIRSQELEIHKHKKANEKQTRQLAQQAQIIQQLKEEIEKYKKESEQKPIFKTSTAEKSSNTEVSSSQETSSQTDPAPSKQPTKECSIQTSDSIVFKQPQVQSNNSSQIQYYERSRETSLAASTNLNYSNAHSRQSNHYSTDTDSDSG